MPGYAAIITTSDDAHGASTSNVIGKGAIEESDSTYITSSKTYLKSNDTFELEGITYTIDGYAGGSYGRITTLSGLNFGDDRVEGDDLLGLRLTHVPVTWEDENGDTQSGNMFIATSASQIQDFEQIFQEREAAGLSTEITGIDWTSLSGGLSAINVSNVTVPGVTDPGIVIIPCFVHGTSIRTKEGYAKIQDLSVGNMILTKDDGYQPILWIGSHKSHNLHIKDKPIAFKAGALGFDHDELRLSPQHQVLVDSFFAELVTGNPQVFVKAKHLVNDHSILRCENVSAVEYFHILLENHEVIDANGVWCETLYPGELTTDSQMGQELQRILPTTLSRYRDGSKLEVYSTTSWQEGRVLGEFIH